MADYVIDASVVAEYLIIGTYTANATAMFHQLQASSRLLVPEFCRLECVNVIWKHVRFQGMTQSHAEQLVKDLLALPLQNVPVHGLYTQALQIGLKHKLAVYDSVYIALAKHMNYPLITVDQPQIRAALYEGVTLQALADFK